jgi:hypothetical protein
VIFVSIDGVICGVEENCSECIQALFNIEAQASKCYSLWKQSLRLLLNMKASAGRFYSYCSNSYCLLNIVVGLNAFELFNIEVKTMDLSFIQYCSRCFQVLFNSEVNALNRFQYRSIHYAFEFYSIL